jgi:hypothetical protein
MTKFDKAKLPSRHVTGRVTRPQHRSYYYAMGMTEAKIHQPLVGAATYWNEAAPRYIALNRLAQSYKMAFKATAGTPRKTIYASNALWKYAQLVGEIYKGAVTHPGAKAEKHSYMDL